MYGFKGFDEYEMKDFALDTPVCMDVIDDVMLEHYLELMEGEPDLENYYAFLRVLLHFSRTIQVPGMPEKLGVAVNKYYSQLICENAMDKIFEECEGEYDKNVQKRLTNNLLRGIARLTNLFMFNPHVIKMQGLLCREEWYNEAFDIDEFDACAIAREKCLEAMFIGRDDESFYSDEDLEYISDKEDPVWLIPIATRKLDFIHKRSNGSGRVAEEKCAIAEEMLKKCNVEYDVTKGILYAIGDKREDGVTKALLYTRQVNDITGLESISSIDSRIIDIEEHDCIKDANGVCIKDANGISIIDESRLENSSKELLCKAYVYIYRVYLGTRSLEQDYKDLYKAVEYYELAKKVGDDFYKYNKSSIEVNAILYRGKVEIYKKLVDMKNEGFTIEEEPELMNYIITEDWTKNWNMKAPAVKINTKQSVDFANKIAVYTGVEKDKVYTYMDKELGRKARSLFFDYVYNIKKIGEEEAKKLFVSNVKKYIRMQNEKDTTTFDMGKYGHSELGVVINLGGVGKFLNDDNSNGANLNGNYSNANRSNSANLNNTKLTEGQKCLELGRSYENENRITDAADQYIQGAKKRDVLCMASVLRLVMKNKIEMNTPQIFLKWFEPEISKDDVVVYKALGDIYFYGIGTAKNIETAVDWYIKAAYKGDENAIEKLAEYFKEGEWTEECRDAIYNVFLYQAGMGSPTGLFVFANLVYNDFKEEGKKDDRLFDMAISLYELAAAKGEKNAIADLNKFEQLGIYKKRNITHLKGYTPKIETVWNRRIIDEKDVTNEPEYMDKATKLLRGALGIKESGRIFGIGDVEVKNVRRFPVIITTREVVCETRKKYNIMQPASRYVNGNSTEVNSNLWVYKGKKAPFDFKNKVNRTPIEDTLKLCTCHECKGETVKPCECGGKKIICNSCGGSGDKICKACNGKRIVKCWSCSGKGYTESYEYYQVRNEDRTRTIRSKCYTCNGSGRHNCDSCYGSGSITCYTCSGEGSWWCKKCHGSGKLTCNCCEGSGKLIKGFGIEQTYESVNLGYVIKNYNDDENIYGKDAVGNAEYGYEGDIPIVSYVSDDVIAAVPLIDLPRELGDIHPITYFDLKNLRNMYDEKGLDKNKSRLVSYRCNYIQREVLELKFIYKRKWHYCQIDETADGILFDADMRRQRKKR